MLSVDCLCAMMERQTYQSGIHTIYHYAMTLYQFHNQSIIYINSPFLD